MKTGKREKKEERGDGARERNEENRKSKKE
jgi:hypothetical protein